MTHTTLGDLLHYPYFIQGRHFFSKCDYHVFFWGMTGFLGKNDNCIKVVSDDTDVLVNLCHFYHHLKSDKTVYMEATKDEYKQICECKEARNFLHPEEAEPLYPPGSLIKIDYS